MSVQLTQLLTLSLSVLPKPLTVTTRTYSKFVDYACGHAVNLKAALCQTF